MFSQWLSSKCVNAHNATLIKVRNEMKKSMFSAGNGQASNGMVESKLFYGATKQILEWRLVQVRHGDHKPLHFAPVVANINYQIAFRDIGYSRCCSVAIWRGFPNYTRNTDAWEARNGMMLENTSVEDLNLDYYIEPNVMCVCVYI